MASGVGRDSELQVHPEALPDDFYEKIRPQLYRRIGRELSVAHRVLDLGCGNCKLGRYLADEYQREVTGVDTSNESFPGPDNPSATQGLLNCVQADGSHLDFLSDAKMDAVVSFWAFHEMKDAEGVLREAFRVLRPGGEILIVDFPKGSLAQRLWNEDYLTPSETGTLLKDAGFVEVCVRTIHNGQVIWAAGFRPADAGAKA